MDPFTQRMLERAKSRREKLDNQKMILQHKSPLQDKINVNEKPPSCENVSVDGPANGKVKEYITAMRKSKLQKLAKFYSTSDENAFLEDEEYHEEEKMPCDLERKSHCKLGKLNELASKIKQWEDDVNHSKLHLSNHEHNKTAEKEEVSKRIKTNEKQTVWDSSLVEKLCSQGFTKSKSQSKLLYNFENKKENLIDEKKLTKNFQNQKFEVKTTLKEKTVAETENYVGNNNEVMKKAAFFESTKNESPKKLAKDPAELSLAERKALFEKNKGEAVLFKNRFFPERKLPRKNGNLEKKENQGENFISTSKRNQVEENKNCFEEKLILKEEVNSVREIIPEPKARISFSKENCAAPQPPPMPLNHQDKKLTSSSREEKMEVEKISPKSGRLYPSLSNLDITDENGTNGSLEENLNESKNINLCLNMTLSDLLELNKNNPTTPPSERSFSQSNECQVLNKMDELLEDALNDISSETEEDPDDLMPSPAKMKKSSSFKYKKGSGNASPLLHTVSFYRKQQQNSCVTTENVTDEELSTKPEDKVEVEDESILVQNKIQALIAEVNKQQTIISQASQALNLCLSTVEFSGSGEQVEGERLLLLASHKRQACLNEVQRLKVENTLWPLGGSNYLTERGDVIMKNISIKLKRDALRSIAAAENLQYFVCLIKSDEQVLATPAVSVAKENLKDMAIQFSSQIKLKGLLSNFKITVEVYNLELGKELLPHDVKYHIMNKKEKKLLTPIKNKKSESKLVKPNIQSPAGPNAVRTSNFQMCGYIVFSIREINRTQWILNKVPYVSPIEGTIYMTIQSQLRLNDEFRGFLTMFDDISGFGAWHRRWCLLSSHFISYWKYPDDETKKIPIGTIDLRSVITENVGVVSRDICARLNTFLLETTRPKLSDDKNSLVLSIKDDVTTIRHLLSADSKQEMTTWCKKLNTALTLLRSWKCNSNE